MDERETDQLVVDESMRAILVHETRAIAIRQALTTACAFIVALPILHWQRWAVYLLELLQERLDLRPESAEEYRQMLEQLRDAITSRLEQGQW